MINRVLDTPVKYIHGVGERRAILLANQCGIRTYRDLLYYFPYRHIDRTRMYRVVEINEYMPYIQLRGKIKYFTSEGSGSKRRLIAKFKDSTGTIDLVWFNALQNVKSRYKIEREYVVFGKPSRYGDTYSIVHPDVEDPLLDRISYAGGLYPMYSTTERMRKGGLSSRAMSDLIVKCLDLVKNSLTDPLPDYITRHYGMLPLWEALCGVHIPKDQNTLRRATLRLKAEEIFFIRLRMRYILSQRQHEVRGFLLPKVGDHFMKLYEEKLPFDLTKAQKRVMHEIHEDLQGGRQMNRLLQGDVGSGKTIIALLTMLLAIDNGYQACLMAPTEILAQQHYETITKLLEGIDVKVELLMGSLSSSEKVRIAWSLESGETDMVIGTHALIQDYVRYKCLALAVIDEQHRFGVYQRSVMWDKNDAHPPHILIMSATPIPRTLAMTLYGDLDVSVIDELPPGRKPIVTKHIFEDRRSEMNFFLLDQMKMGRQIYVVYPLIEENERLELTSLQEGLRRMKEAFPAHTVGMVHGRMKPAEKEEQMNLFVSGKTDILVATTVIEVGVNVPNASVMVIENAERFGLSQLHQLRGRVGRGSAESYCILVTSRKLSEDTRRRIDVMVYTNDGFKIAEEDLRLRGHGDMEGTRQSGVGMDLKISNLAKDARVVRFCVNLVDAILKEDPLLKMPKNAPLKEQIVEALRRTKDWGVIS